MLDPQTEMILLGVGKGVVYGIFAGGIGYIKKETWQTFDPYKFLRTMIIGGVVGGISGTGYSLATASALIGSEFGVPALGVETFLMTSIVAIADNIVKVISRRTELGKLYTKIKEFFGK